MTENAGRAHCGGSYSVVATLLVLAVVLHSCVARAPEGEQAAPGDYLIRVDGREADLRRRSYRMHVPRRDQSTLPAVVVVLHGAFSSGSGIEQRSGFSRLADEHGFVALYPNGYGSLGFLRHWNAGHCCGVAESRGVDDVDFLDTVLDDVARRIHIDPTRVYVVGESNGGMLVHLYAAKRPHRIAAAGIVIGAIGNTRKRIPTPMAPVPMTIVHGTADAVIPFSGGTTPRDPELSWLPVGDAVDLWKASNGITERPRVRDLRGGRIKRSIWRGGGASEPVVFYEIRDWPHRWPGGGTTSSLALDDELRDFDIAPLLWKHLEARRRAPADP